MGSKGICFECQKSLTVLETEQGWKDAETCDSIPNRCPWLASHLVCNKCRLVNFDPELLKQLDDI